MRVAFLSNYFPPRIVGGAEISAGHLARWLASHGHQVTVFTRRHSPDEAESETPQPGLTIRRLRVRYPGDGQRTHGWRKVAWHLLDHFQPDAFAFMAEVEASRPDVLHTHNVQGLGYNLFERIGRSGIPHVHTLHDFGLTCLKTTRFRNGRQCEASCRPCRVSEGVKRGYLRHLRRSRFVSPSAALARAHGRLLEGLGIECDVIPYPLDLEFVDRPRPTGSPVRCAFFGQLAEHKGVRLAIEAVLECRTAGVAVELEVVGRGPEEEALRREFGGRDGITFVGFLPPPEVRRRMRAADLLLIPSLWFENSPLVVYEAIAAGMAVLGTDRGGIPELVERTESGQCVPPGEFKAAVRKALTNPAWLEGCRRNGVHLGSRLAQTPLAREVVGCYQRVLGSTRA